MCYGKLPERWWKKWDQRGQYFHEDSGNLNSTGFEKYGMVDPVEWSLEGRLQKIPRCEAGDGQNGTDEGGYFLSETEDEDEGSVYDDFMTEESETKDVLGLDEEEFTAIYKIMLGACKLVPTERMTAAEILQCLPRRWLQMSDVTTKRL